MSIGIAVIAGADTGIGGFFLFLSFVVWAAQLALWVIGIVNAVRIHDITEDPTTPIIFSVITFLFVHLIFASIEKNKYVNGMPTHSKNTPIPPKVNPLSDPKSKKLALKNSFLHELITAKKFEEKMKDLK